MSFVSIDGRTYDFDPNNTGHLTVFDHVGKMRGAKARLVRLLHDAQSDITEAFKDIEGGVAPNPIGPIQNAPQIAAAASEYDMLMKQVETELQTFEVPRVE